ncbi:kinase-like protein [Artomyces pyxidatus]|uniref:Kinase-like protein n=1 Tax=Artomyces pyxidatus TaxID=48021 RepID=A0ACB8THJ3_9AGAM|nr:kinase-like protein [Artomyces pyxidatus]
MAPSSIPNLVGRTIEGTFEVLEVLGTGGYGVVFRAVDIHSPDQQQYAIKCMLKGAPHSRERHVQCWERYIHLQVNDYPNIVRLHKTIDCGDFVCLVFDIVQGGDLFSHVTEKGTFYGNDELVRTAFIQLIDAIAHCHSKGVYHRDLKLENVLCSRDGSKMFLTDFGLAMLGEWSSKIGVGSIFYMSPGKCYFIYLSR